MSSNFLVSRVLQSLVVLAGLTFLVFALVRVVPGDPVRLLLGDQATPEQIEQTRKDFGLDESIIVQYGYFLGDIARGDLGTSLRQRQPVTDLIRDALPSTLKLALASIGLSVGIGVPLGILTAVKRGSAIDSVVMSATLFGQALPTFWWGIVLITIFSVSLRWFPTSGSGGWEHLVLPAVTLSTYVLALIVRLTRSAMVEVLTQDYVRTARAKGLSERVVLFGHALRNAAIPIVTIIGLQFGNLIGGAVITETVFAWPGIGLLALNAINSRDYPLLQAIVLLSAVTFLTINLIIDLLYSMLDPRIRHG
ncbi:MAG: ABC transporter permease [Thermomicrobiales bacterium]|nr:ABC transporter permease [Thermomicrobiales bacterium]